MAKNSMFELSEKLETKQQQDREQIEKHTLSELKRHAKHLRDGLSGELGTTKTVIGGHLGEITGLISTLETTTTELSNDTRKALTDDLKVIEQVSEKNRKAALKAIRWGWIKYSLPALLICATFLAANWGLIQFQSSRLLATQEQITQAQRVLKSLPQGVKFAADGKGKSYLVYEKKPSIFETQSGEWATELNE